MKQPFGERWVNYVGEKAIQRTNHWMFPLAISLAFFIFGIARSDLAFATGSGIGWFLLSVIWFERRQFYRIIMQRQERIAELENQINAQKNSQF